MGRNISPASSTLPQYPEIPMKRPLSPAWTPLFFLMLGFFVEARDAQFPFRAPAGYGASQSTLKNSRDGPYQSVFGYDDKFKTIVDEDLPILAYPFEGNSTLELSALSDEYFTRVDHPMFPHHSVRIKRSKGWCDTSVEYVSFAAFPELF
jgi:hypothetical protein